MPNDERRVDVISRSAAILGRLAQSTDGVGVRELAADLGLPKSTVLRLLQGLEDVGFVSQDSPARHYKIGPLAFHLGLSFLRQTRIRDRALPHMKSLNELTGETVGLNIRVGNKRILIEQVESTSALLARAELGEYPVHIGAPGKVLISELAKPELKSLLDTHNEPVAGRDRIELEQQLENVRTGGIARAVNEAVTGLGAIAAPVRDASGDIIAALGISAPSTRLNHHAMRKLEPPLIDAVSRLSREFGYHAYV